MGRLPHETRVALRAAIDRLGMRAVSAGLGVSHQTLHKAVGDFEVSSAVAKCIRLGLPLLSSESNEVTASETA